MINLCVQNGLESLKQFVGPIKDVVEYLGRNINLVKQCVRYLLESIQYDGKKIPKRY